MPDPHESGTVSVTFKQDGKDGMWIVFHGSPERVATSMDQAFADEGMVEKAVEYSKQYKAITNIGTILGGSVIHTNKTNSPAWEQAQSGQPASSKQDEPDPLFAEIDETADVAALKALYEGNKGAFATNPELLAAWKSKGKELSTK